MKKLVRLNKRPSRDGKSFLYALRYIENGKRKCKTLGHANLRKAEKECAQKEKELRMGFIAPDSIRLRAFTKDSLIRTGDHIRESTRKDYEQAMESFIASVGNIDLQSVQHAHGEYFRQACLDRGESPATAAKKLRSLNRFFNLGVQRRQLDENPLVYVKPPKVPKQKIRVYTDDEIDRMLRVASELQNPDVLEYDLMITLALTTGLRKSELLNLVWSDVDFDRMTIDVAPKESTKQTWQWKIKDTDRRTVSLMEDVAQLLIGLQNRRPEGYPYILIPPQRYDYIQQVLRNKPNWTLSSARNKLVNNFSKVFNRIRAKAKIGKGTFHDIRRTAITNWFRQGLSEYEVMTLAGHAKFETTRTFYLAVSNNLTDKARKANNHQVSQALLERYCQENSSQSADESGQKMVRIGTQGDF
jgi:integrase